MAADPAAAAESVAPVNPRMPSTTSSDSADGSEPTTTSHRLRKAKIEQRQDQRQRSDGVENALALDDRFGFERDAMTARELDLERRQRLVDRPAPVGVAALDGGADLAQPRDRGRGRTRCRTAAALGCAITRRLRPSSLT